MPSPRKPKKPEDEEAEKFATWLTMRQYEFTHIANESGIGGKWAMIAQLKKARMGTSSGFPDYCIVLKRGALLFIELKKCRTLNDDGTPKALSTDKIDMPDEQKKWIAALDKVPNVSACFCFGFPEAMRKVLDLENLA